MRSPYYLLFALVLVLCAFMAFGTDRSDGDQSLDTDGQAGANVTWSLTTYDGRQAIRFSVVDPSIDGVMRDYSQSALPYWASAYSNLEVYIFDEGITHIGNSALYKTQAKTVKLPSSLTSIGSYAFYQCSVLETIDFGAGTHLKTIGSYAFVSSGLKEVHFPVGFDSAGEMAFGACSKLSIITFEEGVTSLGANCFQGTAVEEVEFPDSLQTVGTGLFLYCAKLKRISLGNGLTDASSIVSDMSQIDIRYGLNYAAPVISGTVCYIPAMCTYLPATSITYGNLGAGFKVYSSYTDFFDRDQGQAYGTALLGRYDITEFIVDPANTVFSVRDGILYNKDMSTLVLFPNALEMDHFDIPRGVTRLDSSSFAVTRLNSVTVPNTVTSIGDFALNFPDGEITIPISVTSLGFKSVRAGTVNLNCSLDVLTWYNVANDVTVMNLGKGVHNINVSVDAVYFVNPNLKTLAVHRDIDKLLWPNLKEINVDQENQYLSSVGGILYSGDGKRLIYIPPQLEAETYVMPSSVEYIYSGNPADYSTSPLMPYSGRVLSPGVFQFTKFTTVRLSDSLLNIGNAAFYNDSYISSVTIPDSVVRIGLRAFERCPALSMVYFEGKIPQLDQNCFKAGWDVSHKVNLSVYSTMDSEAFLDQAAGKYTNITYFKVDESHSDDEIDVTPLSFVAALIAIFAAYAFYVRFMRGRVQ